MSRTCRAFLGVVAAASVISCDGGTQFAVRYAPEFTPGRSTVAIFGVFQGGRMSPEAWYPLSARVSGALGRPTCPVAFGDALKRADVELYGKLDEDVAANGVADEILESVVPKTDAEVIVTLSVHGRVRNAKAPVIGDDPTTAQGRRPDPTMPGRRPGSAGGGQMRRGRSNVVTWSGLELSASLYSVKLKRAVGRITLYYQGSNVDEAVALFADKLREELPGSTCRDWAFR